MFLRNSYMITILYCLATISLLVESKRYLLYDCNPGEGFNLRRDVYMRVANLVKVMRETDKCKDDDWMLVLPPWGRIGYHWKEKNMEQSRIPWERFFDVASMNGHIPVIEYEDYVEEVGEAAIDEVWYLQRYAEGWTDGKWEERIHERDCVDSPVYFSDNDGKYRGWFWGYDETYARDFKCVSTQGQAQIIMDPLCGGNTTAQSVMIDRAETLLHDMFGGVNYWRCRRSMRFAKELVQLADQFRAEKLDSDDVRDKTVMPDDWRDHKCKPGDAIGGPYIAAHVRRKDFLYARKKYVPSIAKVAEDLKAKMKEHNVKKVFIASDGTKEEMKELKSLLPGMVQFKPTKEQLKKYKMGGIAILDQILCSHAKWFVGSKESTFSFRIQDEREIMCFAKDTTFNRLCSEDPEDDCSQPTRWKIVWNSDREIWD